MQFDPTSHQASQTDAQEQSEMSNFSQSKSQGEQPRAASTGSKRSVAQVDAPFSVALVSLLPKRVVAGTKGAPLSSKKGEYVVKGKDIVGQFDYAK